MLYSFLSKSGEGGGVARRTDSLQGAPLGGEGGERWGEAATQVGDPSAGSGQACATKKGGRAQACPPYSERRRPGHPPMDWDGVAPRTGLSAMAGASPCPTRASGEAAARHTQVGDPSAGSGQACAARKGRREGASAASYRSNERPAGIRLRRIPALQQRMAFASEGFDFAMDSSAPVGMTEGRGRPRVLPSRATIGSAQKLFHNLCLKL